MRISQHQARIYSSGGTSSQYVINMSSAIVLIFSNYQRLLEVFKDDFNNQPGMAGYVAVVDDVNSKEE